MKTYEVLNIYGEQVERLIEKNDKPLSTKRTRLSSGCGQVICPCASWVSDHDCRRRLGLPLAHLLQFSQPVRPCHHFAQRKVVAP